MHHVDKTASEGDALDFDVMHPSGKASVKCMRIGREQEPVVVIDNAISQPERLVKYAVAKNDFRRADNYYPGIRMPVPKIYTVALAKNLEVIIAKVFGLNARLIRQATSQYSLVTDLPSSLSLMQRIPHIDAAASSGLAAIHYLMPGEGTGTAFYRHKMTGFERVTEPRYEQYMAAVKNEFEECTPEGYIQDGNAYFERIERVDAVFNRVVLYRGSSLHSGIIPANYPLDPTPEGGRLTITSFYHFK